ncbi:hypothetical protein [Salmonella enterica]|nr:hypothetical protein [Salmonella enterica]WGI49754.1 hypothetical protein QBX66_25275 [Salmonella enterica subsp. diarizonae serovar 48:i:z]
MNVILCMWIFVPWFFAFICMGISCGLAKLVRIYQATDQTIAISRQSNSR